MVRRESNETIRADYQRYLSESYAVPEIVISSGKGAYLKDVDGKRYLDFLSGIATNALGVAHPRIISAVSGQVRAVSHISNFYAHSETIKLASRLQGMVGDQAARVFFCNSGAEANEAAIKISRLTGRSEIIAMRGAFHGRTMGALSITGQEAKRKPFFPLLKGVKFCEFDDLNSLRRAVSRRTAMVIVEPIQGENGVVVPAAGYLAEVAELTRSVGALLAIDAVQTGMGRTGQWFGYEDEGVTPDLITLAKGLGGGLPMGAMIATSTAPQFAPGQHGTTFGGNPVVAAAANAVIDVIEEEGLMKRAIELHHRLSDSISEIPGVQCVRGRGLLIGIVLEKPEAKFIVKALQEEGVLANAANERVVRLAPPLIITHKEVDLFIRGFASVMERI
jgi:acetylornithine/N-succinyldiaminopimelate aminotransferase